MITRLFPARRSGTALIFLTLALRAAAAVVDLNIAPGVPGEVELTWPNALPRLELQAAPALDTPRLWALAPGTPVLNAAANRYTQTFTITGGRQYFRLRQRLNAPPELSPIGNRTVAPGSTLSLALSATDADGDPLKFLCEPLPLPSGAALNAASGLFTFRPDAGDAGVHQFRFSVSDGIATSAESVSITVTAPVPGAATSITGRALDTNDAVNGVTRPVIGVVVSLLGLPGTAVTDANGEFTLTNIPAGHKVLDLDASGAAPAPDGSPYAGFREEIDLVPGVPNVIARPFYLPRVDRSSLTTVLPNSTTTVVNNNLGVTLTVDPNTAKLNGADFNGQLSISLVPNALAPAALPEDLGFGFLITLQPVGVVFTTPARLTMPNVDRLPPGTEVDIWSLDAGTGRFVVVGRGRVTPNGQSVETISGGIRATDWHSDVPPPPACSGDGNHKGNRRSGDCPRAVVNNGATVAVHDGSLTVEHRLPPYRSMDAERALRLLYNSHLADAQQVLVSRTTIPSPNPVPQRLSARLLVAGVDQGPPVHTAAAALNSGSTIQQALAFDGAAWPTGAYPFSFVVNSQFPVNSVATRFSGLLLHDNRRDSPLGAGWSLDGIARLYSRADGGVLIAEGDGATLYFAPDAKGSGRFDSPPAVVVGSWSRSVAAADFNNDTFPDLVTGNVGGSVGLALNDGAGKFLPTATFSAPTSVFALTTGDFNEDNKVDLLLGGNAFHFLPGNGNGTFGAPQLVLNNASAVSVVAADFNGDGNLDFAAPSRASSLVAVLMGNGAGAFAAPAFFAIGFNPQAITAADLNHDNHADIITMNLGADSLTIHVSDGMGGFSVAPNVTTGSRPESVAARDFNHDTHTDLAVVHSGENSCRVFFGNGAGNFTLNQNLRAAPFSLGVAAADFTGDGELDLAIASQSCTGDDQVALLAGQSSGVFLAAGAFPTGNLPSVVVPLDADKDGDSDLAVGHNGGNVILLSNDGAGEFTGMLRFVGAGSNDTIRVGDMNNDSLPDLVINAPGAFSIGVLLGDGSGNYQTPVLSHAGIDFAQDLALADFNLDGNVDVLAATGISTMQMLAGDGKGSAGPPSSVAAGIGVARVVTGDFNLDGFPDAAGVSGAQGVMLSVLLNNRAGGFLAPRLMAVGARPWALTTGDFDENGAPDLAVVNRASGDQSVYFVAGDGRGNFSVGPKASVGGTTTSIAAGDFDGDGHLDLATPQEGTGSVAVLMGNGTGSFTAQTVPLFGANDDPRTIVMRDFNEDGLDDLAVLLFGRAAILVSHRLANGTFAPGIFYQGGKQPRGMTAGDFNDDGVVDLATADTSESDVNVLLGEPLPGIQGWRRPRGDFSTLTPLPNGAINRTFSQGGGTTFDSAGRQTQSMDRNGNATIFNYDGGGRLTQIVDPAGLITNLGYRGELVNQITDPAGRVTSLVHSAGGDLIRITDSDATVREFGYDDRHRLVSQTSKRGFGTAYAYNSAGQNVSAILPDGASPTLRPSLSAGLVLSSSGFGTAANPAPPVLLENVAAVSTDAGGHSRTTRTNPFGSAVEHVDALGHRTTSQRDTEDLECRRVDPNGAISVYSYNDHGDLLTWTEAVGSPLERQTRYTREPVFEFVIRVEDPAGKLTAYAYDTRGNVTSRTDALGGRQQFTYDARGMLVQRMDELNSPTTFTYDARGNCQSITDSLGFVTNFGRDPNSGLLVTLTEAAGTPQQQVTGYAYNSRNLLTSILDPAGSVRRFRFDADGNLQETELPTGEIERRSYDPMNRLLTVDRSIGGLTRYVYDAAGNPVRKTDELNREWTYVYDAEGRFVQGIDPLGGIQRFTYDDGDRVTAFEDTRQRTTSFAYDLLGRLVRRTDALGQQTLFTYDSRDDQSGVTHANGQAITIEFDAFSRPLRITAPDDVSTFTWDPVGNLLSAADNDSVVFFTYDALYQTLTARTEDRGHQPAVTLTNTYDAVGNRVRLSDSAGGAIQYGRDPAGHLARVTTGAGQTELSYDAHGRKTRVQFPNGIVSAWQYDEQGRLVNLRHGLTGNPPLEDMSFTYDATGNVRSLSEPGQTRQYAYDALRRLTSAGTAALPESYAYDSAGNRLSSHLSANHTHDALNRLLSDDEFTYEYDARGNLVRQTANAGGAVTSYGYDASGRMIQITFPDSSTATYRYDALGRRIEKNTGGQTSRYVNDEDNILLEYDGSNVLQTRYIHGEGTDDVLGMERGGQSAWHHSDHAGSIVRLTDAAGATMISYDYDAYGQLTAVGGTMVTPYAFTGREFDRESGLHYFRARYYDARTGRFLTPEPFGLWDTNPNLYAYANNNPVNFVDPEGLWELSVLNKALEHFAKKGGYAVAGVFGAVGGGLGWLAYSYANYTDSQGYRDKVEKKVIEEHENLPGVRAARNVGADPFFTLGYTRMPDPCPDKKRQRSTAPRTYTPEEIAAAKKYADEMVPGTILNAPERPPDPSKKKKKHWPR